MLEKLAAKVVQAQTCVVNRALPVIELNGERLLTTELLAQVYNTDIKNISNNFNRNKEKFIEGKHYFLLQGPELKEFKAIHLKDESLKFASQLYLWTERGANRHCKILDTDKAWEQFDNLEETYFRVKEQNPFENLSPELQSIFMLDKKTQKLEGRVDHLEDTMVIDYGQQEFLNSHARAKVLMALGGKESNAYKRMSRIIFSELWRDYKKYFCVNSYKNTPRVQYKEAIDYIANWEPCSNNKLEILRLNSL